MEKNIINEKPNLRLEVPLIPYSPPRFDIASESFQIVEYLNKYGYAVVKNVASENEIFEARKLFWDWAEKISPNLSRKDPESWTDKNWVGNPNNGICAFVHHSEFAWKTRLLPLVKKAFSEIWKSSDLIVSFDSANAFRPWQREITWQTKGGWWHIDQNSLTGEHAQGRVCVQGFVTYYDATQETGGLCLIPKSHIDFKKVCERASSAKLGSDFVPVIIEEEPILQNENGILILLQAGDLVLWDSRTIHCNTPGWKDQKNQINEISNNNENYNELIRLISYVCMVPYSRASRKVIESRKQGFILKKPTSHWPTKEITTYLTCDDEPFKIEECSKEMLELVGFRENKNFCNIL